MSCSARKCIVKVKRPKSVTKHVGYGEVGRLRSAATTEEDLLSHDHFSGRAAAVSVLSRRKKILLFHVRSTRWQYAAQAWQRRSPLLLPLQAIASSHSLQSATGRVWAVGLEEPSDFRFFFTQIRL